MLTGLIKFDAAIQAVAEARSVDEVKLIRDQAEMLKAAGRIARDRRIIADGLEIQFRAERRLGEMMAASRLPHGGDRKSKVPEKPLIPTLTEAGIDKNLAHRARAAAKGSPEEFEEHIKMVREKIGEAVGRIEKDLSAQKRYALRRAQYEGRTAEGCTVDDLQALIASGFRAGSIYLDPPWTFEVYSGKGKARSAENHFDTMTDEEIAALPVGALAAADCALFLWGVWPKLPALLRILDAWEFAYKTAAFVWVKPKASDESDVSTMGGGYWTRSNSEFCLLATRGSPLRLNKDVREVITAPVGEHSEKPDEARERIERLVPGPYLELFGRKLVPGWTVWGNEIPREAFGPPDA